MRIIFTAKPEIEKFKLRLEFAAHMLLEAQNIIFATPGTNENRQIVLIHNLPSMIMASTLSYGFFSNGPGIS